MTGLAILVPGGSGQLGRDIAALARSASAARVEVTAPSSAELDITRTGSVVSAVREFAARAAGTGLQPIVINAAACTAVDKAESEEHRAFAVNADGPRVLAAACASQQLPLVHLSTDYVFAGDADRPYEPEDPLGPRNAYGRTKAAGESAVLGSGAATWVVRSSWLYGASGENFVSTMTRLEREQETVTVVADQYGSPTWTADLANGLLELAAVITNRRGPERRTLHCTGGGQTSWYEFARAIFAELGADEDRVRPCTTAEFPRTAERPARSVLSNESWLEAGLTPLRDWRAALAEFLAGR
ncbi:dTDP-4-dehydrorhamnose reductase [Haloechinothrix sp. LS1_15]|uniref:dTDP-4-dehydrorhamnose reductase n=1 Tax=Haloechinothrix sp. LS1_15 TaxID=2652248 RepID=UPI00294710F7|nr:dTDP-4-dehydrorhamnose reductase [Haloechinothrix sp. LS1_15]MDV6013922.1 dTDP-4-dehydrorhamnose reductase [Haloechinothrix sp. LS1_15]